MGLTVTHRKITEKETKWMFLCRCVWMRAQGLDSSREQKSKDLAGGGYTEVQVNSRPERLSCPVFPHEHTLHIYQAKAPTCILKRLKSVDKGFQI